MGTVPYLPTILQEAAGGGQFINYRIQYAGIRAYFLKIDLPYCTAEMRLGAQQKKIDFRKFFGRYRINLDKVSDIYRLYSVLIYGGVMSFQHCLYSHSCCDVKPMISYGADSSKK